MYKVAGTSITSLLWENGGRNHWEITGQHTNCREALEHNKYQELIKKYYTFSFVRNPWDWNLSNYLYVKSCKTHPKHHLFKDGISLEDYIQEKYIAPQFDFLRDKWNFFA